MQEKLGICDLRFAIWNEGFASEKKLERIFLINRKSQIT